MYFLSYNKNLRDFSRKLRIDSTLSEVLLWNELKHSKMRGYKFNRQKPLGSYIVDFYCKPLKLVIEVDGDSHHSDEAFVNDVKREMILQGMGLKFLRFDDSEVKRNMPEVLRVIDGIIVEGERGR